MTRRIAMAILLTVWAALAAAGAATYLTARAVLLADLDASLFERASRLPALVPPRRPAAAPESPTAAAGTRPAAGLLAAEGTTDDGGRYLIESEGDRRTIPPVPPADAGGRGDPYEPQLVSARSAALADGRAMRTITLLALARPPAGSTAAAPIRVRVVYSGSAEQTNRLLARLLWTFAAAGAAAGAVAAAVAYRVSRAALGPLRDVARLVGSVSERQLDRRVPVDALPPELAPMADRLNDMLGRLEEAFARRRLFLADASHELRTPVAALLTGLEVAAARDRPAAAYRAALRSAADDAAGLRALVERLMEQVRSEQFAPAAAAEDVDLANLLTAAAKPATTLAAARGIVVRVLCPAGLGVRTEPARVRGIVENLLSNAVEYNRPGGTVTVSARSVEGEVELSVGDTGIGMTPEELARAFEPFYRGDAARGGEAGHLGLGLSLVRTHVEALGGRYDCRSTPGEGTEFRAWFPHAAAAAPGGPAAAAAGRETAHGAEPRVEAKVPITVARAGRGAGEYSDAAG